MRVFIPLTLLLFTWTPAKAGPRAQSGFAQRMATACKDLRAGRARPSALGGPLRIAATANAAQGLRLARAYQRCVCSAPHRYRSDRDPEVWCAWFYAVRAELGDKKALGDYARWMNKLPPKRVKMAEAFPFLPAWRNQNHPAVAKLLREHFGAGADASPWTPLIDTAPGPDLQALVASPLLGVELFRLYVAAQLTDLRPALPTDPTRRPRSYDPPAHARVADLYAAELAEIDGAPAFDLQASQAERDRAIAAMQAFLREHGAQLGETDARPALRLSPLLAFGRLMQARLRPVAKRSPGARAVDLGGNKLRALWSKPNQKPVFGWVQAGEEVTKDGKPLRHFHFVWKHGVERLPAEVLEFPGPPVLYGQQKTPLGEAFLVYFHWPDPKTNRAAGSLDYQFFPPEPGSGRPWKSAPDAVYRNDRPLWMGVELINRTGYDHRAPAWSTPLAADESPAGIQVQLIGPEGPVPRRAPARPRAADQRAPLLPGQTKKLFRLDLNAHFRITKAGEYHLKLVFTGDADLPAGQAEQQFAFQVGGQ